MKVDITSELIENDPLRAVIFPDVIGIKNPDLRIDGLLWEVEGSNNSKNINNLKHCIDEGNKQADYLIINLNDDITTHFMLRVV